MKRNNILFKKVTLIAVLISTVLVACFPEQSKEWQADLNTFPEITFTGFSPTSGFPGTEVTLTGTNFGDVKQASRISFNGVEVPIGRGIISYSNTEIVVAVPELAGTGPISLKVWTDETISSTDFVYLPGVAISSINPETALAGEEISIIGSNFGTDPNAVSVLFNGGIEANIVSITDTEIVVEVPAGADNGAVTVTYDNDNRETVGPDFIYFNPSIVFDDFLEAAPEFGGAFNRSGADVGEYWPSTQPTVGIGNREWAIHGNDQDNRAWGVVTEGSGLLKIGNQRSFGYDISDEPSIGYEKPTTLTLEANFNLGPYANNSPTPNIGRGFVLGFMAQLRQSVINGVNNSPAPFAFERLVGVIVTPESNEILLWDGTGTGFGQNIDTVSITNFISDYDRDADHNLKLTVDTTTGQIVSCELDGAAITFNVTTNNFTDANTNFMVIGGNTAGLVQMDCYDVSLY